MPFLHTYGLPYEVPTQALAQLRVALVEIIAEAMNCPKSWVRVFFPEDILEDPANENEGATTVAAILQTALFHEKTAMDKNWSAEKVQAMVTETVTAIATVIWEALGREIEVEVFVQNLDPEWKVLLKPETEEDD